MDEKMEKLYRESVLFDRSNYYRSREYESIAERQRNASLLMAQMFGEALSPLLEDYLAAIYEELQIEKRHAFALGYEAGKRDTQK